MKKHLCTEFKMREIGKAESLLGIEIFRTKDGKMVYF